MDDHASPMRGSGRSKIQCTQDTGPLEPHPPGGAKYQIGATLEMRTGSARQKNVAWKRVIVSAFEPELKCYDVSFEEGGVTEKCIPDQLLRGIGGGGPPGNKAQKPPSKRKLLKSISELTSTFNEAELVAALAILQAFDSCRASNEGSSQSQAK